MKNQEFIKAIENEVANLMSEYDAVRVDLKKNGYDFEKSSRRSQLDRTISALNMALKEYSRL